MGATGFCLHTPVYPNIQQMSKIIVFQLGNFRALIVLRIPLNETLMCCSDCCLLFHLIRNHLLNIFKLTPI